MKYKHDRDFIRKEIIKMIINDNKLAYKMSNKFFNEYHVILLTINNNKLLRKKLNNVVMKVNDFEKFYLLMGMSGYHEMVKNLFDNHHDEMVKIPAYVYYEIYENAFVKNYPKIIEILFDKIMPFLNFTNGSHGFKMLPTLDNKFIEHNFMSNYIPSIELIKACQYDSIELVEYFLNMNADPTFNNFQCIRLTSDIKIINLIMTKLMVIPEFLVAYFCQNNLHQLLLQVITRVSINDIYLMLACEKGHLTIIKILLHCIKHCPDYEALLKISYQHNHFDVFEYLYGQIEIDLNIIMNFAAELNLFNFDIIKFILKRGVDPNIILVGVCQKNNFDILKLLLKNESINVSKDNNAALKSSKNHIIIDLLMNHDTFVPLNMLEWICNHREFDDTLYYILRNWMLRIQNHIIIFLRKIKLLHRISSLKLYLEIPMKYLF